MPHIMKTYPSAAPKLHILIKPSIPKRVVIDRKSLGAMEDGLLRSSALYFNEIFQLIKQTFRAGHMSWLLAFRCAELFCDPIKLSSDKKYLSAFENISGLKSPNLSGAKSCIECSEVSDIDPSVF